MDFGTGFLNGTGKVHLVTNTVSPITVAANRNVGIGTTNPTPKLEVEGIIRTSGEIHGPATGTANRTPIAFGNIRGDAHINSGSENFTLERTIVVDLLLIKIEGENHDIQSCTSVVTRYVVPGFVVSQEDVGGGMQANTYDRFGNRTSGGFTFVVYKS